MISNGMEDATSEYCPMRKKAKPPRDLGHCLPGLLTFIQREEAECLWSRRKEQSPYLAQLRSRSATDKLTRQGLGMLGHRCRNDLIVHEKRLLRG